MMLDRYRLPIRCVDFVTANRVLASLGIDARLRYSSPPDAMFFELDWAGRDTADLVVALLRLDTPRSKQYAVTICGKDITKCPSFLAMCALPLPVRMSPRFGDDRRVVKVKSPKIVKVINTLEKSTIISSRLHDRMALVRAGMTVKQLLSRGVTRRDLRIAQKRKWIQLEGAR